MIATTKKRRGTREGFTASNPVFTGVTSFEAGTGSEKASISASGNDGAMILRDASDIISLRLIAGGTGGTRIESTNGRHLNIDGDGGLTFHVSGGNAIWVDSPQGITSRILTLHKDVTSRSVSGTTLEQTLQSVTVPADSLGADGGLRIRGHFDITGSSSFKVMRVKFGGTTLMTMSPGNITGRVHFELLLFNDGSTSGQAANGWWFDSAAGAFHSPTQSSASIDTTSDKTLQITGDLADSSDEITLEMSFVEYLSTPV